MAERRWMLCHKYSHFWEYIIPTVYLVAELEQRSQQSAKTVRKVRRYIEDSSQHKNKLPVSAHASTTTEMNNVVQMFNSPEVKEMCREKIIIAHVNLMTAAVSVYCTAA